MKSRVKSRESRARIERDWRPGAIIDNWQARWEPPAVRHDSAPGTSTAQLPGEPRGELGQPPADAARIRAINSHDAGSGTAEECERSRGAAAVLPKVGTPEIVVVRVHDAVGFARRARTVGTGAGSHVLIERVPPEHIVGRVHGAVLVVIARHRCRRTRSRGCCRDRIRSDAPLPGNSSSGLLKMRNCVTSAKAAGMSVPEPTAIKSEASTSNVSECQLLSGGTICPAVMYTSPNALAPSGPAMPNRIVRFDAPSVVPGLRTSNETCVTPAAVQSPSQFAGPGNCWLSSLRTTKQVPGPYLRIRT